MNPRILTLSAALLAMACGPAASATLSVTEGIRARQAPVAGSLPVADAPARGTGTDLNRLTGGAIDAGESIGIFGRVGRGVDRFTFTSDAPLRIAFDFDGYDLAGGGAVAAGYSGLIEARTVRRRGDVDGLRSRSAVRFSVLDSLMTPVGRAAYLGNVTALTAADPVIFSALGPGTYTLVIDGLAGRSRRPTNYDLKISAVPLPLPALMLLSGLGGLALMRRRQAG